MIGCEHCIGSNNHINKKYMIYDAQYDKDAYEIEKQKILSNKGDYDALHERAMLNPIDNYGVEDTENTYVACSVKHARNLLYSWWMNERTHYYDVIAGGVWNHLYGVYQWVYFSEHIYCSAHIAWSTNIFYSYNVRESSYCLGCVGLRNKSYCIFNKQYTKEEREKKADEIFSQMEVDGVLGDFFPGSINPFYFNDTAAALLEDFDQEEIVADGYLWRDEEIKVDIPDWMDVVTSKDLWDYEWFDEWGQRAIDASILKKVIKDSNGDVYRIVKMEYDFLMKYELPLPRKHWLERLKGHFRVR
jgi:hypothetical protein